MLAQVTRAQNGVRSSLRRARQFVKLQQAEWKRYATKAPVVVVTGSSCKTSSVLLLTHILSADNQVLSQSVGNRIQQAVKALRKLKRTDQYVVLEQGTAAPGELHEAARVIKPDVAVVTLVALEHYSSFRSIEAVANEKVAFVQSLSSTGLAVLNFDDPNVRAMAQKTRARVVLFGTHGGDYHARDLSLSPEGYLSFTISSDAGDLHLKTQFVGEHNWLTVTTAAVCALELGIPAQTIIDRVASFAPLLGRMSVHSFTSGPTFILDTAKAPFHSIGLPLETLKSIPGVKKRFVLGQISDFGGPSVPKYRSTYAAAAEVADEICFVGPNSNKSRAPAEDIRSGKFRQFSSARQLSEHLKKTATEGEVILVKSSRNMHLERLMLDSEGAVECWPDECNVRCSCVDCGLYQKPYFEHNGKGKGSVSVWEPKRQMIPINNDA
ncbi:Mur ligase [Hyphomicrobium methylovorum]|uniref:Mur ligase family protein n=1 Tax=Hyphomicrobium methylovorum TaxID=84 RepID=UPI0015E6A28A|nr:Mur ligase family protein [Hyphomicrobium methylovorum]MBA2126053.1 Mur ligase [Hyphomicrobium methylovorum]